jgi:hypothetical protein
MTLVLSENKVLAVPIWMLQKDAAQFQIDSTVVIPHTALLEVVDLLSATCSSLRPPSNDLEPPYGSTQS